MNGEKFISSTPSQRVNTTGYLLGSRENRIVLPSEICRFTLLFRRIAPVKNSPSGTTTVPPPAWAQAAIAFANAPLQSKWLWSTAPNFVISNSRGGKLGGVMRARICGRRDHGCEELGSEEPRTSPANGRPAPILLVLKMNAAPPLIKEAFRNCRRLLLDFCLGNFAEAISCNLYVVFCVSMFVTALGGGPHTGLFALGSSGRQLNQAVIWIKMVDCRRGH